jgi:putative transcriptional regulator
VDSLRGQLLVAAPSLQDPNFFRTVVLIVEHNEEGAMGIVLNRATDTGLDEAVPDLLDVPGIEETVHAGGPVQPHTVILVAEFTDPEAETPLVVGSVGVVGADTDLDELPASIIRGRAFAGYAGWGPGQLEGEVGEEAWFTVQPLPEDLLADEPDSLWSSVLERKGGWHRVVARMPADPSLN